jgi:hypothetical protein
MIKGNEWGPRTTTELILGSFILILDLIIAANIFAQMAVFVQMSNRNSSEFQQQVDLAYTAMNNLKIPRKLQE